MSTGNSDNHHHSSSGGMPAQKQAKSKQAHRDACQPILGPGGIQPKSPKTKVPQTCNLTVHPARECAEGYQCVHEPTSDGVCKRVLGPGGIRTKSPKTKPPATKVPQTCNLSVHPARECAKG